MTADPLFEALVAVLAQYDQRPEPYPEHVAIGSPRWSAHYQGAINILTAALPRVQQKGGRPPVMHKPERRQAGSSSWPDPVPTDVLDWTPAERLEKPVTRDRRQLAEFETAYKFKAQILGPPDRYARAIMQEELALPKDGPKGVARMQAAAGKLHTRTVTNHAAEADVALAFAILRVGYVLGVGRMPAGVPDPEYTKNRRPGGALEFAAAVTRVLGRLVVELGRRGRVPAPFREAARQLREVTKTPYRPTLQITFTVPE